MMMTYGSVYVASVAMGARDEHTVRAFLEAESYPGPSLIMAYSHCIAHGIDRAKGEDLVMLLRLEEAGAAAVVLHSLFEEQIEHDQLELHRVTLQGADSYGEALSYFPEPSIFHVGHDLYLRHLEQARSRLSVPVIVSLNGSHPGQWVQVARRMEDAGASALELNIYSVPTDPDLSSEAIETQVLEIVAEVRPNLLLSTPHNLRLPLRWIALLHGRHPVELAALLCHGPGRLVGLEEELSQWLLEHEHATARELIGCMSQERCPDPSEYERAQYMRAVQTYHPAEAAAAPGPW